MRSCGHLGACLLPSHLHSTGTSPPPQEVVAADEGLQAGRGRMLVFARDVASAEATADALEGACGLPVLRYHKVGWKLLRLFWSRYDRRGSSGPPMLRFHKASGSCKSTAAATCLEATRRA